MKLKKTAKICLLILIGMIVFAVMVLILIDRDEQGHLHFSFQGRESKILDKGFNRLIDQDIDILNLQGIDWQNVYNKALAKKVVASGGLKTSSLQNITVELSQQEKEKVFQAFVNYLSASNANLDEAKNPFSLALKYRDEGKLAEIDQLIAFYQSKISHIESITPPEEAIGYHLAKLRLLRETILILEDIKLSEKGKSLEEAASQSRFEYLAELNLTLKKYLIYFFYPHLNG